MIRQQVSAALETRPFGAAKIGMLGNRATVEALVSALPSRDVVPVVLDPVLAASSGGALLDAEGMEALRALLLPNVSLLTPNIPEAAALLGDSIAEDEMAMIGQAEKLLRLGPRAVLMKGGHASGPESTDWLVLSDGEILRMTLSRSPGSVRGTGCALATAVAAGLARGLPLAYACRFAKQYVGAELADAVQND
jgi:hydroxymethylpyrimidine/phosphomethylpyrimidine kinase